MSITVSRSRRSQRARWLTDDEMAAWLGYRRLRLRLDAEIARELEQSAGLSMADYDVLSTLEAVEDHTARVGQLAVRLSWSQSRLSRQLGRMQQRGLVSRETAPGDGRGTAVRLTPQGLKAIRSAAPDHVDAVRRHFVDLLDRDQLAAMAAISDTVLTHLDDVGAPAPVDLD